MSWRDVLKTNLRVEDQNSHNPHNSGSKNIEPNSGDLGNCGLGVQGLISPPEPAVLARTWRVLTPEHDSHITCPEPVDADTVRSYFPEVEMVEPVARQAPQWREPNLHGLTMGQLEAEAHPDEWAVIKGDWEVLEAFARSLVAGGLVKPPVGEGET